MLEDLLTLWSAAGLDPRVDGLGDGTLVTVTRGARAVPFDDEGNPLLWLAPVARATAVGGSRGGSLADWVASDAWNLGAERLWIGPEIEYMVRDRRDFAGSYHLPPTMDPGSWRVVGTTAHGGLAVEHEMQLHAFGQQAPLSIAVAQTLSPLADPIAVRSGPDGREPARTAAGDLKHLGWRREVTVRRAADDQRLAACQAWVLIQVDVGGTVVVPGAGGARVTDYFEPVDDDHLARLDDDLLLRLTGTTRYKVGVPSGAHRGSVLYRRDLPDDRAALWLRTFDDTQASRYLEQPPDAPDHGGDSVFVYNDDGRYGDFGEVEVLGRALEPDVERVTDAFDLHIWWGGRQAVADAAARLTTVVGRPTTPAAT